MRVVHQSKYDKPKCSKRELNDSLRKAAVLLHKLDEIRQEREDVTTWLETARDVQLLKLELL